jgi:hypothetical protein
MSEIQISDQMKRMRRVAIPIFLALGVGGNWINWYWAHYRGFYYDELAMLAPPPIFIALYWVFFPKDYAAQFSGISVRMWIVIALLLGVANLYAFSHGLY